MGAAKLLPDVRGRSQFVQEHAAADDEQGAQVHGQQSVGFFIHGHGGDHVLLHAALCGWGLGQRGVGHAADRGDAPPDFLIALRDGLVELLPAGLALFEDEEVFLTVVAEEGGFDFVQRRTKSAVTQGGEFGGVAFGPREWR